MKKISSSIFFQLRLLNIFIIALTVGIIFVNKNNLPPKLPLFFSKPWGEEQLAENYYIFFIPLLSTILLLLSVLLNEFFPKKDDPFLPIVSQVSSLLFSFLGIIAIWNIISLVT